MARHNRLPCAVIETNREGRILALNTAMLKLVGGEEELWLTRDLDALFPTPSRIFLQTHVWPTVLRDGRASELRLQLLTEKMEQVPIFANCQRVETEGEESFYWVFFVSKERVRFETELLNAKKRAEASALDLAESLRRQREADAALRLSATVFESALDAMIVADRSNNVLLVNPAFTRLTGFACADIVGRTFQNLWSERHDKSFASSIDSALTVQHRWEGEIWIRTRAGSEILTQQAISFIEEEDADANRYVAILRDITERKQRTERLRHLALYDSLTSLPNRYLLLEHLKQLLDMAKRDSRRIALLFLDLNGFKAVNDRFGHDAGDRVLQEVAARLRKLVRPGDIVARLGGDEFVVVLDQPGQREDVNGVAQRVIEAIALPISGPDWTAQIGTSIGIALNDADSDARTLLKQADIAMYHTKVHSRNSSQNKNSNGRISGSTET